MDENTQSNKAPKARFGRLVKYVSLTIIFIIGIVVMIGTGKPGGVKIKTLYILGFAEDGTNRIRVRYSEDGQQWSNGNPPNEQTSVGVGLASDGLLNIAFYADSNALKALWGVGPTAWDTGEPSLTQKVFSAPSAAYAGDGFYLVAFRTVSNIVAVRALDTTNGRHWLTTNFAPADSSNSDVWDRPSIAILNGKVLLAWGKRGTGIVMALGDLQISNNKVDWRNFYTFNLTESGYNEPKGDPTLTHDGSKFYLGLVRGSSGGGFVSEGLFVYSSSDGIAWTLLGTESEIPHNAYVNIAARADGNLLAAVVGPLSAAVPTKYEVHMFQGGNWVQLNANTVFGFVPSLRQFALISNIP